MTAKKKTYLENDGPRVYSFSIKPPAGYSTRTNNTGNVQSTEARAVALLWRHSIGSAEPIGREDWLRELHRPILQNSLPAPHLGW